MDFISQNKSKDVQIFQKEQNSKKLDAVLLREPLSYSLELVSIELYNFKSFSSFYDQGNQKQQIVGPFTKFTGIIGPNGVGKSNIFDAIAFCLNIPLPPGKVKHIKELAHRPIILEENKNPELKQGSLQEETNHEFYVKLNLLKRDLQQKDKVEKFCIQRGLKKAERDDHEGISYISEFILNENFERPLTYEEYKKVLKNVHHFDLLNQFIIYQNQLQEMCFGSDSSTKLVAAFEHLSQSEQFKPAYNQLQNEINEKEEQQRNISRKLTESRQEKAKMKGLSDFQKQIDECLKKQKETQSGILALSFLQDFADIESIQEEQIQIQESVQQSTDSRVSTLQELKNKEGELRKLENNLTEKKRLEQQLKASIYEQKAETAQATKTIEENKKMLVQQQTILQKLKQDLNIQDQNRQSLEKQLEEAEKKQKEISDKQQSENPEILKKRDEYLKIKSQIQMKNSLTERERLKIQKQLQNLVQQSQATNSNIERLNNKIKELKDNQSMFQNNQQENIKVKKEKLAGVQNQIHSITLLSQKSKDACKNLEMELINKEFELKELEVEKQVRAQDTKLAIILDELKKKCKGYLGQFYELIKPNNPKFDVAVKVSLAKTLRYLVVDSQSSAVICTDFLKEKQIQKDLLILENIPKESTKQMDMQKINSIGGEMLSSVINITFQQKSNQQQRIDSAATQYYQLQKAISFFTQGRVVCPDIDSAIRLKREAACTSIVTLDGTEFKSGMISSGKQSQNLFSLNLGQASFDRDIKRIQEIIKKYDNQLSEEKKKDQEVNKKLKDFQKEKLLLEQELQSFEQSLKSFSEQETRNNQQLINYQFQLQNFNFQMDHQKQEQQNLTSELTKLDLELQQTEKATLSDFCSRHQFQSIADLEQNLGFSFSQTLEQRQDLQNMIFHIKTELSNIEQNSQLQNQVSILQTSIESIQKKLLFLQQKFQEPSDNQISEQNTFSKDQETLKQVQEQINQSEKEKSEITNKQQNLKEALTKLTNRMDSLIQTENQNKIKINKKFSEFGQKMQQSFLEKTLFLDKMGLSELLQTQLPTYDNLSQISKNCITLFEMECFSEDINNFEIIQQDKLRGDKIREASKYLKDKFQKLQIQEQKYTENITFVVESDEQQVQLSNQIFGLKAQLDTTASQLEKVKAEFADVRGKRRHLYLSYFDFVATQVKDVYKQIMGEGGIASLTLMDRDQVDGQIMFDFRPPNKQFDFDISTRSGGEKTIAGLSLIFAMALSLKEQPHFILLDEVDAHLDPTNSIKLANFIKQHKSMPQIFIISHKEDVISMCDSLIGVTQDDITKLVANQGQQEKLQKYLTARSYSLDLSQFA